MTWSPQQEEAIKAVRDWLGNKKSPQVFRLFGYAGTGKTTLAKELAAGVKGPVLYACFTGKAAQVLRTKGCDGASTIHSLIYTPRDDEETGKPKFVLNRDSMAALADLLIVDEVSMVGDELAKDLLSYKRKVLVLGDPAQLPPVKGEGYFINATPDVMLTEVHRQAAENPIIRMSMDVREGRGLQFGEYGDSRVIARDSLSKDELRELVVGADQLLCGLNRTRLAYNARMREIHGRRGASSPHHPIVGERLVCLRNNRVNGLLNGGLWESTRVKAERGIVEMRIKSLDDPALAHVDTKVPEEFFLGTEDKLSWPELRGKDQLTFGYALTVHKSQGSQWDNVVLFDESHVFRQDREKHLYTGITRAAERVTVIA